MPETAVRPQKRAEGLYGGAAKRCYGKFGRAADTKKAARGRPLIVKNFLYFVFVITISSQRMFPAEGLCCA